MVEVWLQQLSVEASAMVAGCAGAVACGEAGCDGSSW